MTRDVVVIGSGHNGLVSAFYLARAGLSVEVLEAKRDLGGACKTEELLDGYQFSTCASVLAWMRPKVLADTQLIERGLQVEGGFPRAHLVAGGRGFIDWEEPDLRKAEIRRFSRADSEAWDDWSAIWSTAKDLLGPYLLSYPPTLAELSQRAEKLGASKVLELLLTSSIAELGDRYFESPEMRGLIEAPHDVGSLYDHGSAFMEGMGAANQGYSETGEQSPKGFVKGGMGRVTKLLAEAAEEWGATIRTESRVEQVVVEEGRVCGVTLADGTQIASSAVLVSTDLKLAFSSILAGVGDLSEIARTVGRLRTDVAPLKMHLALSGVPRIPAFEKNVLEEHCLAVQPTREYHERAWDDAKSGRLPRSPFMNLFVPSVWDASLAPSGMHTMSIWMQFAPVQLAEGSWEARRPEMSERILKALSVYSPGFEDFVVDHLLLTPPDLEERVLLTDGNIHHIDMVPSQMLWQRPCQELSRYRAPITGLYFGAAGSHPFGEVTGGPGHNAAHALLEDLEITQRWQEIDLVE